MNDAGDRALPLFGQRVVGQPLVLKFAYIRNDLAADGIIRRGDQAGVISVDKHGVDRTHRFHGWRVHHQPTGGQPPGPGDAVFQHTNPVAIQISDSPGHNAARIKIPLPAGLAFCSFLCQNRTRKKAGRFAGDKAQDKGLRRYRPHPDITSDNGFVNDKTMPMGGNRPRLYRLP